MKILLAFLLFFLQTDSFIRFTYCKESAHGLYERQCVELDPAGKGQIRFKRRGADETSSNITLSEAARERFLAALAATNNLEQGDSYESPKKVADLGKKHLTLELVSAKPREAEFNYSPRKEVVELVNFFDGLINQETIVIDIDTALQYDRLSIPKRLDQIEAELKSNRIGDPERMIPMLDKIQADARIVNYARSHAGKIKDGILAKKPKA